MAGAVGGGRIGVQLACGDGVEAVDGKVGGAAGGGDDDEVMAVVFGEPGGIGTAGEG